VSTADYFAGKSGMAPRPSNSLLDLAKIAARGYHPREWRTALSTYLASTRPV
jgi:dTDP-4-dehydrorhamnose reductase